MLRTNYAYPATRRVGLQGSLSWYTNTRWKMNGGFNLYVCANAGPVYGCRTPGDPCVDNAAGLANLLYPPVDGESMRPVSSVRWELLSIGLQVCPCHDATICLSTLSLTHSLTKALALTTVRRMQSTSMHLIG
eukprot:SAG11_NODE_1704_length_4417_cov_1.891616_3_plen_133_part_00